MDVIVDSKIESLTEMIRHFLRQSKGWWGRISRESGCKIHTLTRIAHEDDYFPRTDEAARIERWFRLNGVRYVGPMGKQEWQLKAWLGQERMLDPFETPTTTKAPGEGP